MKLIKLAGLIPDTDKPDILEVLIDNARTFYQAGGILTFSDWAELTNSERIAMVMARQSFQVDINETTILETAVDKSIKSLNKNI